LEDYWNTEWRKVEEDFKEIAGLGFNTVRIHIQFGKFMLGPDAIDGTAFANLDKIIALAGRLGLHLDITGLGFYRKEDTPKWYLEMNDEEMQRAQASFWSHIAKRYANEPAIFCFDLQNEPVIAVEDTSEIVGPPFEDGFHYVNLLGRDVRPKWTSWIREKYGNETELKRRWRDFPKHGEGFDNLLLPAILDRERNEDMIDFAHDKAKQWARQMRDSIRAHDRNHLITIGLTQWSLPFDDVYSSFAPQIIGEYVDFISIHIHLSGADKNSNYTDSVMALRAAYVGKPVVLEEFSFLVPKEARERFINKTLRSASGYFGYYWGKTPSESILEGSIKASIAADSIERLVRLSEDLKGIPLQRRKGDQTIRASIKTLRLQKEEREKLKSLFASIDASGKIADIEIIP